MRVLALLVALSTTFACGGSSPSPTGPTPPPPPPPPAVTLRFTPETTAPQPHTLSLRPVAGSGANNVLDVDVWAHGFTPAASASKVRLELRLNPALFEWGDTFLSGPYLKQGGALASFDVRHDDTDGTLTVRADRPDSLNGSTGAGVVLTVRLHAKAAVRAGSSPVQFHDTEVYDPEFGDSLQRTYAGTVTIQ